MDNRFWQRKFHFVGIGGIGMSGLGHLLLERGCRVSGSDLKDSPLLSRLRQKGAEISVGHHASHLGDAEAVVYSSCIPTENPEREEALRRGLSVLSRGELLASLFHEKPTRIAVSGSHGKTTTTALITWMLQKGGYHPTYLIGGIFRNTGQNAGSGPGEVFVTEADESDGSFLKLTPTHALVTNMDAEHLDYYRSLGRLLEAYASFLDQTKKGGRVFVSSDCPQSVRVQRRLRHPSRVTFGFSPSAHYFPEKIDQRDSFSRFECVGKGNRLGPFELPLPGWHNIANTVGAIALGRELGLPVSVMQEAVSTFEGVERRMEIKTFPALTVVEDYAHHPTEIRATLEALKGMARGRRIVGVFQPHRFTRTQLLAEAFGDCFKPADLLFMTEIYGAGERPIPGVTTDTILREVRRAEKEKPLLFLSKAAVIPHLLEQLQPGDILIFLGAGDIHEVAFHFAECCRGGALSWIDVPCRTV